MLQPIIETHCHLDYLKSEGLDDILKKSTEAGIEKIITISVQKSNIDAPFNLSQKYSQIFCSQGIHPHHATDFDDEIKNLIIERAKNNKVVAVGEIGLDYYYNHSPREVQLKAFESQLELASNLKLPAIVHSRDADEDTQAILKNFSGKVKGVIHSFTSGEKLAEFALNQGFYLGFNGIITFKKAQNVQEIVKITPLERILFETDAPFLTPVPHRGKENAPYFLPHICQKISELKNCNLQQLMTTVYENSNKLFFK